MRLPCCDVAGGVTCGYHAVMLHGAIRAVTMQ